MRISLLGCAFLASCATLPNPGVTPMPVGARYVAMGSSFAAGPGITRLADDRDPRCTRSFDNYPRQVARRLQLDLVDVSCGGATTGHILKGWNELPPQIDALSAETRLVTVTIGGNDVGYIGSLFAASCSEESAAVEAVKKACAGLRARMGASGSSVPAISEEVKWAAAEAGLAAIAAEVSRRAPKARLVFVEYLALIPKGPPCAAMPLPAQAAQKGRDTAERLSRITRKVAAQAKAEVLPIAETSRAHHACAKTPWVTGFVPTGGAPIPGFAGYHPNVDGMTAVADALVERLR